MDNQAGYAKVTDMLDRGGASAAGLDNNDEYDMPDGFASDGAHLDDGEYAPLDNENSAALDNHDEYDMPDGFADSTGDSATAAHAQNAGVQDSNC